MIFGFFSLCVVGIKVHKLLNVTVTMWINSLEFLPFPSFRPYVKDVREFRAMKVLNDKKGIWHFSLSSSWFVNSESLFVEFKIQLDEF